MDLDFLNWLCFACWRPCRVNQFPCRGATCKLIQILICASSFCVSFFLCVCFTSFFVFRIADLPLSPGVVYYHLLLRQETRIPGVAPFSFRIGIWDLFVHRGQKSIHPQPLGSCGPLQEWDACNMPHHNPRPQYETGPGIEPGTFGLADECSTTELTLLLHWSNSPPEVFFT